jgi:hypothetical protein
VYPLIINASVLGRVPSLLEAAAAGNRVANDESSTRAIDENWPRGSGVSRPLDGLLTNAASRFLNDLTTQDPVYREVLLTDQVTSDVHRDRARYLAGAAAAGNAKLNSGSKRNTFRSTDVTIPIRRLSRRSPPS